MPFDYGGTTGRESAFNVVEYGAKGDMKASPDGVMSSSTNPTWLTCATSQPFLAADVGKYITVVGAGAAGVPLNTTIASVTSASVAVLNSACLTSIPLMAAPVNSAFSSTISTGTLLHSTTYYYRVTAVSLSGGETLASTETSTTTGAGADTYSVTVNWAAVSNAQYYVIYGRTTGAEQKIATTLALTYVDTGSITPSGALPAANRAGAEATYGTDDTTAIQAAITAAKNQFAGSGGIVYFPTGTYICASTLSLAGCQGVILRGTGYGAAGSVLRYVGSGSGTFITHNNNYGGIDSLGIEYINNSFTGTLVAMGYGSEPRVSNCFFGSTYATNVRSAAYLLDMSNSNSASARECLFDGSQVALRLATNAGGGFSQGFTVSGCDFNNGRGQVIAHIKNPCTGTIVSCNFENLYNGTGGAIATDASTPPSVQGLTVQGCWMADVWNNQTPTAVAAAGSTGLAAGNYTLAYSYVLVGGNETALSAGVTVTLTAGQQINVGAVPFNLVQLGDSYYNPTNVKWYYTAVAATMTAGFIVQNANGNAFSVTGQGNAVTNTVGNYNQINVGGQGIKILSNFINGTAAGYGTGVKIGASSSGVEVTGNYFLSLATGVDISASSIDYAVVENNYYSNVGTSVTGTPQYNGRIQTPGTPGVTTYSGEAHFGKTYFQGNGLYPPGPSAYLQAVSSLYASSGLPGNGNGSNGDYYFRSDPVGSGSVSGLYRKLGGVWAHSVYGNQAPAYVSPYTPDPTLGEYVTMTLSAAITVNAPVASIQGQTLTFIWTQNGTGTWAVTYNAVYKTTGTGANIAMSTTASTVTIDRFYCTDGTNWRLMSRITGQT